MTSKPSLEMLRSLTDEHVLRLLMEEGRMTRAEIATRTGISKTTISESMRRLDAVGMVVDTGQRSSGRGRAGSYYALAGDCGLALVASISPAGVVVEAVDAMGGVVARAEVALDRAAGRERASAALASAALRVRDAAATLRLHLAVVSAADPVDRRTGRLVHLPDAPFLVGDLDPVAVLADIVEGEVLVDNDVNWAARAERRSGSAAGVDDFVYVHLGEGVGCAVVSDGEVRRGHLGVAGEIAHVLTQGPSGSALPFTEVFADLGLRRPASTAIDVDVVVGALRGEGSGERYAAGRVAADLADAVAGVLVAAVAFGDPQLIVVGGPWGHLPAFLDSLAERAANWPRRVPIVAADLVDAPEVAGVRDRAVELLRTTIVQTARDAPAQR